MKTLAIPSIFLTTVFLLPVFLNGCSSAISPNIDQPELMNMEFTRSQYSANQALILRATPNPDVPTDSFRENPLTFQLISSSGTSSSAQFSPWSDLSDEEMVEAIKDGPGKVILRIKEADQESARNSKGELVRSEEAMNNITDWVQNHEKLTISWIAQLSPTVVITITEKPTSNLVNLIRNHENVEFMEPSQFGEFLSASDKPEAAGDLASVIIPSDSFAWQAGDTITAEIQQPDGSTLKDSVTITE